MKRKELQAEKQRLRFIRFLRGFKFQWVIKKNYSINLA